MDRFTNMKSFVSVVEAGGFAAAARRIHISKAVISKRIKQLEGTLGVQLLLRSTRSVTVTDIGAVYYERCLRILSEVADAEAEISSHNVEPSGHLKVTCPASFAARYLDEDLCAFQREYSDITVELRYVNRAVNPITEDLDIALQIEEQHADNVAVRRIAPLRRVAVASAQYLAKFGRPNHPKKLKEHRCIHNDSVDGLPIWRFRSGDKEIIVPIQPIMVTNNGWLMREAVLGGNGIAFLPLFFIEEELINGSLIPILTGYPLPMPWLLAHFADTPHLPLKTRLFLDRISQRYRNDVPWERRLQEHLGGVIPVLHES